MPAKVIKKIKFRIQMLLIHLSINALLIIFKLIGLSEIRRCFMDEFNKLVMTILDMLQNGTVKIKQLTIEGDNQYFRGTMTIPMDDCLFSSMFYYGCLENEIQSFIQSKIKKEYKYCVIDIGASIGAFSNQLHSVYKDFRYVCIEPSKESFKYLKINTKDIDDLFLFNLALADYDGESEYYCDTKNIGNRGLFGSAIKEFCAGDCKLTDKVVVRNTTQFFRDNLKIFVDREIILKIDTQGSDLLIFQKIFEVLGQSLSVIVVEVTPSCISKQEIENVIKMLKGFNVYYYRHNQNYYIHDFEKVDIIQLELDFFNSFNTKRSFTIYASK